MNYQNTIYVRLKEFKFSKKYICEDGALSKLYDISAVVSGDSDCRHTCDLVSGVTKIF